jgi:hypothetical protein
MARVGLVCDFLSSFTPSECEVLCLESKSDSLFSFRKFFNGYMLHFLVAVRSVD